MIAKYYYCFKRASLVLLILLPFQNCGLSDSVSQTSDSQCSVETLARSVDPYQVIVGDMILHVDQIYSDDDFQYFWPEKFENLHEQSIESLGVSSRFLSTWDDGILPLVFTDGVPDATKDMVFKVCSDLSKIANVRCVERTDETGYVNVLTDRGGCYATIGKRNFSPGELRLRGACSSEYIVTHELLHVFGFYHEHQHPDRDNFVRVIEENIRDEQLYNFTKVTAGGEVTEFDYNSIMIYRSYSWNKQRNYPSLVKRSPACDSYAVTGFPADCIIPTNRRMSDRDKEHLVALYGLPNGEVNPPNPPTPDPPSPPVTEEPEEETEPNIDEENLC